MIFLIPRLPLKQQTTVLAPGLGLDLREKLPQALGNLLRNPTEATQTGGIPAAGTQAPGAPLARGAAALGLGVQAWLPAESLLFLCMGRGAQGLLCCRPASLAAVPFRALLELESELGRPGAPPCRTCVQVTPCISSLALWASALWWVTVPRAPSGFCSLQTSVQGLTQAGMRGDTLMTRGPPGNCGHGVTRLSH